MNTVLDRNIAKTLLLLAANWHIWKEHDPWQQVSPIG
jgi:hypothetical protein